MGQEEITKEYQDEQSDLNQFPFGIAWFRKLFSDAASSFDLVDQSPSSNAKQSSVAYD
jgi:hypothetical protein